jgi:aminoglycoside phosphotransferase (APT) family kinase protein
MIWRVRTEDMVIVDDPRIDATLVRDLIASQFPHWADLDVEPVSAQGWSNRAFRLGRDKLVRLPRLAAYEAAIEKECFWLPKLAPSLPLPIPLPLAVGQPQTEFKMKWAVFQWIAGEAAALENIDDLDTFAHATATFLLALQSINASDSPLPGKHNFYRGGSLATYDSQVHQALACLQDKIDVEIAREIWQTALACEYRNAHVWIHGDVSLGNLLVQGGVLSAVIDFGNMAVGDPACDLVIAWNVFEAQSRAVFRNTLRLDDATWARGRGWALWKAIIIVAGLAKTNAIELATPRRIIEAVIADHQERKLAN